MRNFILDYHKNYGVDSLLVKKGKGLFLIEATSDGVVCNTLINLDISPLQIKYKYIKGGRYEVGLPDDAILLNKTIGNKVINVPLFEKEGISISFIFYIVRSMPFIYIKATKEKRHTFYYMHAAQALHVIEKAIEERDYPLQLKKEIEDEIEEENSRYFTLELQPWGTVVATKTTWIHSVLCAIDMFNLRYVQWWTGCHLGITLNVNGDKALLSYRKRLYAAKVVDCFSLPEKPQHITPEEEENFILFYLYPYINREMKITKYKNSDVVTYIDNITNYYITITKTGDSYVREDGWLGMCVKEASPAIAEAIAEKNK